MSSRWLIAGALAGVGAYWLTVAILYTAGLGSVGWSYGAHAIAALVAGGVIVVHAPLRPWREPAAAGALAVALIAAVLAAVPDAPFRWYPAQTLHPWPAAAGVAAASAAVAAAGGLAIRRVAPVTVRTDAMLLLATLVGIGSIVLAWQALPGVLPAVLGALVGGFITQLVIVPKAPWLSASGAAASVFVLLALDGSPRLLVIAGVIITGPVLLAIGSLGAVIAWRTLRGDDDPDGPDVPTARAG